MTEAETRKYNLSVLAMFAKNCDRRDVAQFCCWWLENERTHGPIPYFDDMAGEASIWAAAATPDELESHLGAILTEIDCTAFHVNAMKRIFAQSWSEFSDRDRAGFLAKYGAKINEPA